MIRIDVVRGDGEVTRLVGQSGIAVCAPELAAEVQRSAAATVSLRCSSDAELAWNLATLLLASVRHVSPEAYAAAHRLEHVLDAGRPDLHRRLPPQPGNAQ